MNAIINGIRAANCTFVQPMGVALQKFQNSGVFTKGAIRNYEKDAIDLKRLRRTQTDATGLSIFMLILGGRNPKVTERSMIILKIAVV
ncbi:MAG: hypothetical protein ABIL70_07040 [candidate division WOR-3 bacterium]